MITGNVIGGILKVPNTLILVDEAGNEYTAVATEEEVNLDATENDIRLGTTAATNTGVTEGKKVIPIYHTTQGYRIITKGSEVSIPNQDSAVDDYDYTKLQSVICLFNSNLANSVSTQKVSINDNVYNVQSTESISTIVKNHDTKKVEFGIVNDSDTHWIVRFFTCKEI